MELNLGNTSSKSLPVISRLVVHDDEAHPLFSIAYDTLTENLVFHHIESEEVTDIIIQSKSTLTHDKGVEALGTFIAGASGEIPQYKHLLSLYIPTSDTRFTKYHLTLDSSLEHINLESSLLLAAECYTILYDPLQQYIETQSIDMDQFPLLSSFFHRTYTFEPFMQLLNGTDLNGTPLEDSAITSALEELNKTLLEHVGFIDGADLFFMTISGAITAHINFMATSLISVAIEQISHSIINSPGMFTGKGSITLWFPFSKNKIGKINRAISTTLNTLNYASSQRDIKDQVQTNMAHKFHELVDIVATEVKSSQSLGLETNVGFLVCSIKFKEAFQSDMTKILQVSQEISTHVKNYGQTILSYVAKAKKFSPIVSQ